MENQIQTEPQISVQDATIGRWGERSVSIEISGKVTVDLLGYAIKEVEDLQNLAQLILNTIQTHNEKLRKS